MCAERGMIALVSTSLPPQREAVLSKAKSPAGLDLDELGLDQVTLDHIGVAVRSIAAARRFYEALGMTVSAVEEVEHERVRTAMLSLGESRLELLEPLGSESVVGRFLERRGEGLHHIALRVADIDAKWEELRGLGFALASDAIRVGAGGHRYFFVHPSSTGGVLVEIVGDGAVHGKDRG